MNVDVDPGKPVLSRPAGDHDLPPKRLRKAIPAAIGALLLAAGALYWWAGRAPSGMTDAPVPQAPASPVSADDLREINALPQVALQLRERLARMPEDGEGWALLARTYAKLGEHEQAKSAFKTALALRPRDTGIMADYADTLAFLNNRSFAGEPIELIERALRMDPEHQPTLMLAGLAAFDRQDFAGAIGYWERVVKTAGPQTPIAAQAQYAIDQARKLMPDPA